MKDYTNMTLEDLRAELRHVLVIISRKRGECHE